MKTTLLMAGAAVLFATPCMAATAKTSSNPSSMMANYYLMKADTNGDGMVSKDEASAYAQKCFDMADTNHDGMLSKKEIAAAKMKEHQEMMGMKSQLARTGMKKAAMSDTSQADTSSTDTTTSTTTDTGAAATVAAPITESTVAPAGAGAGDTNGATGIKGSNPDIPPSSDVQLGGGSTGTSQGKGENNTAHTP